MEKLIKVGRRKRAIARLRMKEGGDGTVTVNNKAFDQYFPSPLSRIKVMEPFKVLELNPAEYELKMNVVGGGITGQADACRLALSRALIDANAEFRGPLKKAGLLTRDARKVERKKYGKKKARKSTQFSKR